MNEAPMMTMMPVMKLFALPAELVPELLDIWITSQEHFTTPHALTVHARYQYVIAEIIRRHPGEMWTGGHLFIDLTTVLSHIERVAARLQE